MSNVHVVLVRARRPANVAAACRAMKNLGVRRLTLIDNPAGLDDRAASALAYGAWDVLDEARTVSSLREAVADATIVVATSARVREGACSPRELARDLASRAPERVALVFGPEDSGLRRDELGLAHVQVRIPTHAAQPSLNLAQAVLVMCYELSVADLPAPVIRDDPARHLSAGEFEACIDHLRRAWLAAGYLNPDAPDVVLGELRSLLWRANPTQREVVLLRGLARHTLWAAGAGSQDHGANGPEDDER